MAVCVITTKVVGLRRYEHVFRVLNVIKSVLCMVAALCLAGMWDMYFTMYLRPAVVQSGGMNCCVLTPAELN